MPDCLERSARQRKLVTASLFALAVATLLGCSTDDEPEPPLRCSTNQDCELPEVRGGVSGTDFACLQGKVCAIREDACIDGWRFPERATDVFFVDPGACVPTERLLDLEGRSWCGTDWTTLDSAEHCGSCGNACQGNERCAEGSCEPCGGRDYGVCDGHCVYWGATLGDRGRCGSCTNVCERGSRCRDAKCETCASQGLRTCGYQDSGSASILWWCLAECTQGGIEG